MNTPSQVAIGKIGRPHGIKGHVLVFPSGTTLETLTLPHQVTLGDEQGAFGKTVLLTECSPMNQVYKCKFTTFDSPEAAEILKGQIVYIPETVLPPQQNEREFYHFELKGMRVVASTDQHVIGTVLEVHNYPTTDAIEIQKEDGRTFIIGLDPALVLSVNRQERIITIALDLLEEII